MKKVVILLPLLLALLAMACGSKPSPTTVPPPTPAPSPATVPPPTPAASKVNAEIKNFTHQNLTVKAGTTVTWTNRDDASHTSTERNGKWDSKALGNGQSFSFTLNEPGTYNYFCSIHPTITATVTVNR